MLISNELYVINPQLTLWFSFTNILFMKKIIKYLTKIDFVSFY